MSENTFSMEFKEGTRVVISGSLHIVTDLGDDGKSMKTRHATIAEEEAWLKDLGVIK